MFHGAGYVRQQIRFDQTVFEESHMRRITRLEVVTAGAKWNVTEHGIGRLSTHQTRAAAEAAARAIAALHTPSELIIRNQNGSIDSQHKYPQTPKQLTPIDK
jgi:Uncharacterized protein conserved in bacteria (DUF2188)